MSSSGASVGKEVSAISLTAANPGISTMLVTEKTELIIPALLSSAIL